MYLYIATSNNLTKIGATVGKIEQLPKTLEVYRHYYIGGREEKKTFLKMRDYLKEKFQDNIVKSPNWYNVTPDMMAEEIEKNFYHNGELKKDFFNQYIPPNEVPSSERFSQLDFIKKLDELNAKGIRVFSRKDFDIILRNKDTETIKQILRRAVENDILIRVCNGIYVYKKGAMNNPSYIIEYIARKIRPFHVNYISMETALSEYGVISQMTLDHLTIMTTGRSGIYETPFGTIEFTHTKREEMEVVKRSFPIKERPLRFAYKKVAVQDLISVKRNLNMVDFDELDEEEREWTQKRGMNM